MSVEDRLARCDRRGTLNRIEPLADGWARLAERLAGRRRRPWIIAAGVFLLFLVVFAGFAVAISVVNGRDDVAAPPIQPARIVAATNDGRRDRRTPRRTGDPPTRDRRRAVRRRRGQQGREDLYYSRLSWCWMRRSPAPVPRDGSCVRCRYDAWWVAALAVHRAWVLVGGGGRNRTHRTGSTRPTRFEDEGGHQTPFTSAQRSSTRGGASVDCSGPVPPRTMQAISAPLRRPRGTHEEADHRSHPGCDRDRRGQEGPRSLISPHHHDDGPASAGSLRVRARSRSSGSSAARIAS